MSQDESQRTYAYYAKHQAVPDKLAISDDSIKRILEYMVDVGDFKEPPAPSKYIDRGYWEKATRS